MSIAFFFLGKVLNLPQLNKQVQTNRDLLTELHVLDV